MVFVLDSSMFFSWVIQEEKTVSSQRLLSLATQGRIVVPALWVYEVANTFHVVVRRKRMDKDEAALILKNVTTLDIEIDARLSVQSINDFYSQDFVNFVGDL